MSCRSAANGSSVGLNTNKIGKSIAFVDRKTFAITNTRSRKNRPTSDSANAPTTGVSNKGGKHHSVGLLDDTVRLSSIGQFLLGLNKHDDSIIESITTSSKKYMHDYREEHMSERGLPSQQHQRKFSPSQQHQRKFSPSQQHQRKFSPSQQHQRKFTSKCDIEGALFPVLSDDCLVALWK